MIPEFSQFEHYGETAMEEWAAALVAAVERYESSLRLIADDVSRTLSMIETNADLANHAPYLRGVVYEIAAAVLNLSKGDSMSR